MTKRLVDIDDRLLSEVVCLLGASSATEAVNRALAEVVRAELGRRQGDRESRPRVVRRAMH